MALKKNGDNLCLSYADSKLQLLYDGWILNLFISCLVITHSLVAKRGIFKGMLQDCLKFFDNAPQLIVQQISGNLGANTDANMANST